jgi:hypothetical protein
MPEYIETPDGRLEIPDGIIAASDNRDLVARYVAASPEERTQLAKQAITGKLVTRATPPAASAAVPHTPSEG